MISKDFQDTAGMCSCTSKRLKLMKSRLMSCLYLGFGINEHLLGVLQLTVQHIQLAKNISKVVDHGLCIITPQRIKYFTAELLKAVVKFDKSSKHMPLDNH